MKKRFYRLGGVLTALMLMLSMVLTTNSMVYAANTNEKDDTGTITVSGISDTSAGLTVTAYPIVLAYYNSTGNFSDYVSLYDVINIDSTVDQGGNISGLSITEAMLDSIRNTIAAGGSYSNLITFGTDASSNVTWTNGSGTTYIVGDEAQSSYTLTESSGSWTATVPVGAYLIIVTGAESVIYNEAVVSVYYNADLTMAEGSVDMSKTIAEGNTWLKEAQPQLDKSIVTTNATTGATEYVNGTSADIGDIITYQIKVSPIPNYGGSYPVFNVTDILSEGLTYVDGSLKVYVITSAGQTVQLEYSNIESDRTWAYSVTPNSLDGTTQLYVNFALTKGYTLNDYEGGTLYIEYQAELNEKAVIMNSEADANINTVTLVYTTDSRTQNNNGSDKDQTYVYTFDIDGTATGSLTTSILTKYGEEEDTQNPGTNLPLSGATFGLYTDSDCTKLYTSDVYSSGCTVTTGSDGKITITGLAEGTYYLKEVSAPSGYTLNSTVYQVEITATYNNDGTLNTYIIAVNGTTRSTFTVDYTGATPSVTSSVITTQIQNTKTTGLPNTGAYGTLLFTLIGCAVMIVSAAAYIRCRDKKSK